MDQRGVPADFDALSQLDSERWPRVIFAVALRHAAELLAGSSVAKLDEVLGHDHVATCVHGTCSRIDHSRISRNGRSYWPMTSGCWVGGGWPHGHHPLVSRILGRIPQLSDTGCVSFIERVASREVYRNPWLVLREDDIRRPDGSHGIYSVVDKPTYALVMPYDGRRFRLVEQFRYPLGARRWEFPQGPRRVWPTSNLPSSPRGSCARRRGLRATSFEALGLLDVAAGMTSQRGWVFLATGISEGDAEREHEEQDMRSEWFSREDVEEMIRSGVLSDAQSVAAYGLFLLMSPAISH